MTARNSYADRILNRLAITVRDGDHRLMAWQARNRGHQNNASNTITKPTIETAHAKVRS